MANSLSAAILSWSGGSVSTANWNDSANWGFVGIPNNGDTLIFSASQPRLLNTNNIAGLTLNQIRFVGAGGGYDIRGNSITLTNGVEATNSAGANTIENNIVLGVVDQSIDVTVQLTLSGILSGSVGLIQNGGGTLLINGPSSNVYGGTTTVNAGLMQLDKVGVPAATAIPGDLVIGNGSSSATVRNLTILEIADTCNMTINRNGLYDLNGSSETIGSSLTLNGNGSITTGGGTLTLSPNANINYNPIVIAGSSSISGNLNVGSGACTISVGSIFLGGGLDITANITGTAAINVGGGGFVEFYGVNTFTNVLTLNACTLAANNNASLGATSSSTVVNGSSVIQINASANITNQSLTISSVNGNGVIQTASATASTYAGLITLNSVPSLNIAGTSTLELVGTITGGGGFTKFGTGTLTLSGSGENNYTGATTVNDGVVQLNVSPSHSIGSSSSINIGDGTGAANSAVIRYINGNGNQIYIAVPIFINSDGLLDLNGHTDDVGAITLTGGNITTGAGTIQIDEDIHVASSSQSAAISGNLYSFAGIRNIVVDAGTAFYNLNLNAVMSDDGSGYRIMSGVGRPTFVQILNNNTFTGPLIIDGLSVGAEAPLCLGLTNSGTVVSNTGELFMFSTSITNETVTLYGGSTFTAQNNCSWYGPVILAGDSTIKNFNSGALFDIVGVISGTGNLSSIGPAGSTNRFSGLTANIYAGTTTVASGTLVLHQVSSVAIPGNVVVNSGAILQLAGSQQTPPSGDVLVNAGGLFEFSTFANYSDTLRGAGQVDFGVGGWIYLGLNNGSSTFNGTFTGTGFAPGWTVGKTGTGTFTMNGNSTYTAGITHVLGGKMIINGSQPAIAVTVDSGSTLGGSGTIGNLIANGTIAPGNSPGILSSGNVAFSSGGKFNVELTGPNPGADYDQLNVTGTNNLANATLNVTANFNKPVALNEQFVILNNDLTDAITGTFNGLPNGASIASGPYNFTINYSGNDGNDVVLTLTNLPGAVTGSSITSGNGDHGLDPNDCNNLYLVITNKTGTPMTGVHAVLSTRTPGVLIGQPASAYADVPAHGTGTNITAFQISMLPQFVCGNSIALDLAVSSPGNSFTAEFIQQSGEPAVSASRYDNGVITNIPDVGTIESTNVVSGFAGPVLKVTVSLWLTHPIDSDLSLSLISPDGISVPLTINTGAGANFGTACSPDANRTTFDDGAATPITAGSPPFVGTFRPQGTLSSFIGGSANGNWRLHITDGFAGSVGALRCWSLFLEGVTCSTGSGACDTCIPPINASVSAASPVQTNRWFRDGQVSSCAFPKVFNGFGDVGTNFHYNAYTFTNSSLSDACVSVELQSGSSLMAAMYLNSFDNTAIGNNFLGDGGNDTGSLGGLSTFSCTVPAGAKCVVVVNEVSQGSGTQPFTLTVTGLPCPPPFLAIDAVPASPNVHLHWPSWAGGYNLEATPSLWPSNWTTITNEALILGNQYNVTNQETPASRYYRLHKP